MITYDHVLNLKSALRKEVSTLSCPVRLLIGSNWVNGFCAIAALNNVPRLLIGFKVSRICEKLERKSSVYGSCICICQLLSRCKVCLFSTSQEGIHVKLIALGIETARIRFCNMKFLSINEHLLIKLWIR